MGIQGIIDRLRRPPKSVLALSRDLHDPRVSAVASQFTELNVSRNRVIALLFIIAWSLYWYLHAPGAPNSVEEFNHEQAFSVMPALIVMLAASILWWIAIRNQWVQQRWWTDAVGAATNFLGVAIILPLSWNLNCFTIIWLPMACITIGARYTTPWFFASIAVSTLITTVAAPNDYWEDRPYFALFTYMLVIGLPLSVNRLLQTLRVVAEAAIHARDAHSRFVSTISHELRTPLNAVVSATEMLDGELDPARRDQLVELLSRNAIVLRNRVNEVLDVRAIETGRVALMIEPFTFNGMLRTLHGVVASSAKAKRIELAMSAGSAGDIVLRSDPARVEQVLTNLLTNAIKFTPANGRVELTIVSTGVDAQGRILIESTVTDNGIGIPDAAKAKIFDPFYQVSTGPTRSQEGVGLGLNIVRSLTQLLDGKIAVENNPGGGTVFRWTVPFVKAAPTERPSKVIEFKQAIAQHRSRVEPLRVLVIDDNASNLEISKRLLQMAGHTMVAAQSGAEGLRQMNQSRFDIVFLDLHMPDRDGWQILADLRDIKRQTRKALPPVVVLSADATPQAMEDARKFGAIGYLTKPIASARMLTILEDVSAGQATRDTLDIVDATTTRGDLTSAESFLQYLRSQGNAESIKRFVDQCLKGLDDNLADMTIALSAGDAEASVYHLTCIMNEFLQLDQAPGVEICKRLRDKLAGDLAKADLRPLIGFIDDIKRHFAEESIEQPGRLRAAR
jgi:two-component system sensor histidine kinase RpfC